MIVFVQMYGCTDVQSVDVGDLSPLLWSNNDQTLRSIFKNFSTHFYGLKILTEFTNIKIIKSSNPFETTA